MDRHITPQRLQAKIIPVKPFDLIVFGGTGDLALRKLIPALYYRYRDRQIPETSRIIGASRAELTREAYLSMLEAAVRERVHEGDFDQETWDRFAEHLDYLTVDALGTRGWKKLPTLLGKKADKIRVFYLSVPPDIFGPLCERINKAGMIHDRTRVVIEKPIGHNLETSREINDSIGAFFREDQIYRIDHYLGKETVQNLMALRFANSLFEPLWTRNWIDHVQITVAEQIGIGGRGSYYDRSGALRDMVQNHILQLLCLVAMEIPTGFSADDVRNEKLKVLRALTRIEKHAVKNRLVMGQYRKGVSGETPVPGYLEEEGIPPYSHTETYVAIKAEVDNWRWSGVPFYLRTGKRMPVRTSEIVIQFKTIPHVIFGGKEDQVEPNRLVIRLQPDEGIRLYMMTKVPGPGGFRMQCVPLNLSFAEAFKVRYPGGYERLVMDVVRGNQTLFMRRDEVEAAWAWADSVIETWERSESAPQGYTAGTWGPSAAIALIERDGRTWYEGST